MKYVVYLYFLSLLFSCTIALETRPYLKRSISSLQNVSICPRSLNLIAENQKKTTYSKITSKSNFNWQSVLNKSELSIDDILKYRKKNGYDSGPLSKYNETYEFFLENNKESFLHSINSSVKKSLGEGYNGEVVLMKNGDVYKFPKSVAGAISLEVEYAINRNLYNNYHHYGIKVDEILGFGENGIFLKKKLINNNMMASDIISNGKLSQKQLKKLKLIFKNAKRYARETGIGLDLKADNLQWDGSDWILFDAGPRTSYLPYGFTLDVKNFKEYLKVWTQVEPDDLSRNIELKDFKYLLSKKIEYRDLIKLKSNHLHDLLRRKLNDKAGSISASDIEAIVNSVPGKGQGKRMKFPLLYPKTSV